MRAKAKIYTINGYELVNCYPMKIGYLAGFLHKDYDQDTWAFSDFSSGKRVTGGHTTRELCIERATEMINRYTEQQYIDASQGETVVNTTYVDYVPMIGDVVRIQRGHGVWISGMDEFIGKEITIRYIDGHENVRDASNSYGFRFTDGDFIPLTALEREFVNEPGAPATLSPTGFYHRDTHPNYEPKIGDRVIITSSYDNWGSGMNEYVGKECVISRIIPSGSRFGASYEFENERDMCYEWSWEYKAGHFKVISQHHAITKPSPIKVSNEVVFSSSFLDFLHSVKDESRIAHIILSVRELQYNGVGSLVTNVLTASEVNYLTYRADNGNISYLPKGKEHKVTADGKWARDGRQDGKAGKVMRKIFTKSALKLFKETDFEIFNNKFKARFEDGLKFDILPNSKIPDVYLTENRSDDGSLGGSCMRNVPSNYFEIYTNCDKLSIVTLTDKNGELQGRALLWDVIVEGEEAKFLDRFYVSKDSYYDKFVEFAREKGFFYKEYYKTYDNKTSWINPNGDKVSCNVKIKTPTDFEYYPYIDTFTWGDDGTLTNYDGRYTYNNTGGTRDGDGVYDDIDERYIDEDEAVTLYDGRVTHQDNAVCVTAGRSRYIGNYYPASECYRCGDEYYHENDVNRC